MSDPSLARLRRRQHEVATRAQLLAAGVTRGRLQAEIDARRWQRLNERVISLHNGPLNRRQQIWAVLLSAHPHAALAGLTVMELHRVRGFATADVHVLVPQGTIVLPVPGVHAKVHQVRRFPLDAIRLLDDLRVTLPDRAFIDAAGWEEDKLTAARMVVAAVQQRVTQASWMRTKLAERPNARHRKMLLLLLNDLEGGAQALSEVEFLQFCQRHGFPRPTLQVRMDAAGRRRYLDATFRRADGSVFHVEIDGGVHLKLEVRAKDDIKDNDARLRNKLVLRYASVLIYLDDPDVVRQIREGFAL